MSFESARWEGLATGQGERLERALDTTGAGSVLLQPAVNRTIQDISHRELNAWTYLEHKPGSGQNAIINRRTPATTGGTWDTDTTDPTEDVGTYAQTSFRFRTAKRRVQVSRLLQATGRTYADVMAEELGFAVPELIEVVENAIFNGDNDNVTNQPDGLITLIQATSGQIVLNTSAAAGDDLDLSKLDEAIDLCKGSRKVIFASRAGRRKLNAALQAQQNFNDKTEVAGGFRVLTYDDIPVVPSTKMLDTLVFSGAKVTAFTGGGTTALIVVSMDHCWIEELTALSILPLARDTERYERVDMFADLVPVLANTLGGTILAGIKAS